MNEPLILSPITLPELVGEITKAVRSELDARTPTPTPPAEELLTREQAAQLLGVTMPTLRDWTRRDIVPGYRVGSRIRYKRNEVLASLARIRTARHARP